MNSVDFLPSRIKVRRRQRLQLFRQLYLMFACTAALIGLCYLRSGHIQEAQAKLSMVEDRLQATSERLALKETLEREYAELQVVQRIEKHLGSRVTLLHVLSKLEQIMPSSMALTDMRLETIEELREIDPVGRVNTAGRTFPAAAMPQVKSLAVKRVRLTLTGLAPNDVDVANFIGQLSACALFEDAIMGYAKNVEVGNKMVRKFEATCYIVR